MNTHTVTDQTFHDVVIEASNTLPVLVDFWAPWCGPCKALGPVLEQIAAEFAGRVSIVKLNTDEQPATAQQHAIRSIPAVKLFSGGRVIAEFVGAQPLAAVRQFLQQHLPAGDAAASAQPPETPWGTASQMARAGQFSDAQSLLDGLSPAAQSDAPVKTARAVLHFARIAASPDETDAIQSARVRVARNLLAGRLSDGYDELLQVMQRNRRFATGQGREDLLAGFELAEPGSPIVAAARRSLAGMLN